MNKVKRFVMAMAVVTGLFAAFETANVAMASSGTVDTKNCVTIEVNCTLPSGASGTMNCPINTYYPWISCGFCSSCKAGSTSPTR